MKIAVVTFVRAYNHGAVLQCYALHRKLKELGIDNEVLDYYPDYFWKVYNLEKFFKWRSFPGNFIKKTPKYLRMRLTLAKRNRGFERFIRTHIQLSAKQYHTYREVERAKLGYDAFVVGSDQVWQHKITEMDPVFFLNFDGAQEKKKYSYAASFGFLTIPEGCEQEYRQRLAGWDKYCVREQSGAVILRELLDVEAKVCCDPTILLTKQHWEQVCSKTHEKQAYVLVYYVNSRETLIEQALKIAREQNLKVIVLTSANSYEHLMGDEVSPEVDYRGAEAPDTLLGLLSRAKYVLTDSFHGTVFSLIFHKQFLTLIQNRWGKNYRALELLRSIGLSNRTLDGNLEGIDAVVDWSKVDDSFEAQRQTAIRYLLDLPKE